MKVFGPLYGLGSPFGIKFYKEVGNMGFDGTFGNKKGVRDFPVGQPFGNVDQYLVFPFADPKLFNLFMVNGTCAILYWAEGLFVDVNADKEKDYGNTGNDDLDRSVT